MAKITVEDNCAFPFPRKEVFKLIAYFPGYQDGGIPGVENPRFVDEDDEGLLCESTLVIFGMRFEGVRAREVVQYPNQISVETLEGSPVKMDILWEFSDGKDGGCDVALSLTAEIPGILAFFGGSMVARSYTRNYIVAFQRFAEKELSTT